MSLYFIRKMKDFKLRTEVKGRPIRVSKKIERLFCSAKNIAHSSDYGKIRHGAILVKGGSVLNSSYNKENYSSFGKRFRSPSRGHATVHAELGVILGMPRSVTTGADVYVCRINRKGEFRNSKPCAMCHAALKHVGVKRVYYTTSNNTVEMYKL
jgi:tRNA(Arg) A34 adenosine deaminase TadA